MPDLAALEARIQRLEDLEEIKRLKYCYLRALDTKAWDELAETLAEDATTEYSDGAYRFQGRDEILRFLKATPLAQPDGLVGVHHVSQPEIEITEPGRARGTWALYNYLIHKSGEQGIRLCAFYYDEYVKLGGSWKIQSTGYRRVFEETWSRKDMPSLKLTAG
jgi:hypothetical protein